MSLKPYIAATLGVVVLLLFSAPGLSNLVGGHNDFLMLYGGARLAGTRNLYNPESIQKQQLEAIGLYGPSLQFSRLPFYAALLWPLGKLPYRTAYLLWQSICFAALAGFIVLWRNTSMPWTLAACCWSLPLWFNFIRAQDLTLVLLALVAAIRLRGRYPFAAGLILSLCCIKYHLFVLLPLLIAGRREWRFGSGIGAGGMVLAAVSFAVAGARWPVEYLTVISSPAIAPNEETMPNLHRLFLLVPYRTIFEVILGLVVACLVWFIVRNSSFEYGMAAVLLGGLLVSYHAYVADCVLLIPALLVLQAPGSGWYLRELSLVLLAPFGYIYLMQQKPFSWLIITGFLLLLIGMWYTGYRARRAADNTT